MNILPILPIYNNNYKKGYIGFTNENYSLASIGINIVTNWQNYSNVPVSHCFIVTGENSCIEATTKGVKESSLSKYFNDPNYHVYFRKPRYHNEENGEALANYAKEFLDKDYDFLGALANLFINPIFSVFFFNSSLYPKFLRSLNRTHKYYCSELIANLLSSLPVYHNKGCLIYSHYLISPQLLFEDTFLFQDWKYISSIHS